MKNFLALMTLIVTVLITSCTKQEDEIVGFTMNVSAFNVQTTSFKGLTDDPFIAFAHVYPTNSSVLFIAADGKKYQFYTGDYTLETFKFGLPVGTYKMTGSGGSNNVIGTKDMSYTISEQTIIVTSNTTSIPITVTPTCFLILVADPNLLIDETNKPRIAFYTNYNLGGQYPLLLINPSLRYIYGTLTGNAMYANFLIMKKDKSQLFCDPISTCFKVGFSYKILINTATTPSIINPVFQQTDLLNF